MAQAIRIDRNTIQTDVISAGVVAGLIGGVAMGVLAMIVSAAYGQGFFTPLYLIDGLFLGVDTLVAGPGAAIVGLLIHLAVSAFFGACFAMFINRRTTPANAFAGGIVFGIAVWAFMNFLIIPWANPTLNARADLMPGWWFVEHLVYGGSLFLTPSLARAYLRRDVIVEERERPIRVA